MKIRLNTKDQVEYFDSIQHLMDEVKLKRIAPDPKEAAQVYLTEWVNGQQIESWIGTISKVEESFDEQLSPKPLSDADQETLRQQEDHNPETRPCETSTRQPIACDVREGGLLSKDEEAKLEQSQEHNHGS